MCGLDNSTLYSALILCCPSLWADQPLAEVTECITMASDLPSYPYNRGHQHVIITIEWHLATPALYKQLKSLKRSILPFCIHSLCLLRWLTEQFSVFRSPTLLVWWSWKKFIVRETSFGGRYANKLFIMHSWHPYFCSILSQLSVFYNQVNCVYCHKLFSISFAHCLINLMAK